MLSVNVILFLMLFTICVTFLAGIFAKKIAAKRGNNKLLRLSVKVNMAVMALLAVTATILIFSGNVMAADDTATTAASSASGLGYLAAALSTGLACIGAGIAVGISGSAALGAISEDSTLLGKTLIFLGLAEGIAIYGLIISIMILGRL
ncbi:MAG: ATP synthase subunit C [Clostridiales bacterium]|nr:ATP synthase subunit C [Clostridiales bacterium]